MMCASIGMAIPVIVAQFYLQAETGKLTKLDNISQIDSIPKTKYYSVKHYYADKKLVRFKTRFKVSGRYSSDYDMYIYAVVPVYDLNHTTKTYNYKIGAKGSPITSDNALIVLNNKIVQKEDLYKINPHAIKNIILLNGNSAMHRYGSRAKNGAIQIETKPFNGPDTMQVIHDDNLKHTPFAWLGVKYQKTIRNRLSSSEKDERFKHFAKKSEADFKSKSFDNFVYLDRVSYSTDLKQYTAATNLPNYQAVATSLNILTPNYDSFDKRMGDTLPWIFGAFGIGSLFVMLMLLLKPLRGDVVQEMDSRDSTQQIIDDITGKK
ncbi:MAG TPA: hypothetical protein VK668_15695 [Mucilaginibacter sp.]|nr:hypothetical protein [Mucilaginibacter sp.]